MVNRAPPPGRFSPVTRPLCPSATRRQVLSPRPVPVGFVVANGVNSLSAMAGSIPAPVSFTENRTPSGPPATAVKAAILEAGLTRQALHAAVLGFVHPVTGEKLRFESPLPTDMATLEGLLADL